MGRLHIIRILVMLALPAGCTHESYILGHSDHRIDIFPDTADTGVPDTTPPDIPDVPTECADSDGDGVCDSADRCPGHDDRLDADGDTVPDGCDACSIGDDRRDADGDGVPDACDCDYVGVICDPNATCVETGTVPTCMCNPGYEGDGFSCTDIDECAIGTAVCDVNATCTNTPGSYICTCNEGYEGDGRTCTPIDHCARGTDLCDVNATCAYRGPGTYTCTCNPGYTGDGFTCTPIDPDICISVNDGPLYNDTLNVLGDGLLFAMKFTALSYLRVDHCEVFTGDTSETSTLGIWSHDYSTNKPLRNLGTASWTILATDQWQGVDFSPSILLGAGPDYWLVWGPRDNAQATQQTGGSLVEVRVSEDGGSTWGTPFSWPMKYRCTCE